MNSFISWIGGKKLLRDEILARLPPEYDKYIEVFGGAGWVLFRKPPDKKIEVYNDFNSNLVNLFRCVRDKLQGCRFYGEGSLAAKRYADGNQGQIFGIL